MIISEVFDTFSKAEEKSTLSEISAVKLSDKLQRGEYNLVIDQARYPISSLPEVFKDYDLNPDYQRRIVWDVIRKSRLIESLIVNVPIPPVFLYETNYNEFEVMDGLQRISTIIGYLSGEFSLQGLELWSELNGFHFHTLPENFQQTIKRRYLSSVIIVKESVANKDKESELKRFVFERLNTGGVKLSDQEIRNALYSGSFNDLVNNLSEYEKFKKMMMVRKSTNKHPKDEVEQIDRMESRELVLRFFTYKDIIVNNSSGETKKALDTFARMNANCSKKKIEMYEKYFKEVFDFIYDIFGENAFRKSPTGRFEKMVFDTISQSCSVLFDEEIKLNNLDTDYNTNKYKFFLDNKNEFNGKYTDFSNVKRRVSSFSEFLKGRIESER